MAKASGQPPSKKDTFNTFLAEGWVSVHFDARKAGVKVPKHLRGEARLVLQYGRDMPVPITDLEVTDDGVQATLSFSRTPHHTHVPWSAVFIIACTDGRGVLYQDDIPPELLEQSDGGERAEGGEGGAGSGATALADVVEPLEDEQTPDGLLAAGGQSGRPTPKASARARHLSSVPAAPPPASDGAQAEDASAPSVASAADEPSDSGDAANRVRRKKPVLRLVK